MGKVNTINQMLASKERWISFQLSSSVIFDAAAMVFDFL
jgi:hypothetical protein